MNERKTAGIIAAILVTMAGVSLARAQFVPADEGPTTPPPVASERDVDLARLLAREARLLAEMDIVQLQIDSLEAIIADLEDQFGAATSRKVQSYVRLRIAAAMRILGDLHGRMAELAAELEQVQNYIEQQGFSPAGGPRTE